MTIASTQFGESDRRRQRAPIRYPAATVLLALSATWVAGFVDATGWMLLSHIYTSNMTGNSISMAVQWLNGNWAAAAERAWPVLVFVCGLLLGAIVTEFMVRRGLKSFSAANLTIELVVIGAFIVAARPFYNAGEIHASGWNFNLLVAFLALGMGLQNQTITRIGALAVHTTHVTGTLTKFGEDTAEFLFWLHDRSHTPRRFVLALRLAAHKKEFRDMAVNLLLWVFFTVGAIAAVFAREGWGPYGLFAPIVVLIVLVLVDLTRPIMASSEAIEISKSRRGRK